MPSSITSLISAADQKTGAVGDSLSAVRMRARSSERISYLAPLCWTAMASFWAPSEAIPCVFVRQYITLP
jgi:hypothetical protein